MKGCIQQFYGYSSLQRVIAPNHGSLKRLLVDLECNGNVNVRGICNILEILANKPKKNWLLEIFYRHSL